MNETKYVRKKLKQRKESQAMLAEHLGMSRQRLNYKLNKGLSYGEMNRIARFFGMQLSEMIKEIEGGSLGKSTSEYRSGTGFIGSLSDGGKDGRVGP